MICRLAWFALCLVAISACQTVPNRQAQVAADSLFAKTTKQLPAPAQLPAYNALYQSFLQDGGALPQSLGWRDLQQQLQNTELANCKTIPWQEHLPVQLFNLGFYRYALACFRQHKDQANISLFSGYQNYVQQGILASGDGKHAYSAYQINNFADAAELATLAGMEIQDYQVELASNGNALYYSLHLYDPAAQRLTHWYFNNQRFLHAVDKITFPFIGLFDGWQRQMIPQSADASPAMMTLMGYIQQQDQKYADAEQWYLKAIGQGSLEAPVLLDQLAQKQTIKTPRQQTQALVLDAADRDYLPALHWLAYQRYLKSKASDKLADIRPQLEYINQLAGPGQAELTLARYLFNGQFAKAEPELGVKLMQMAAAQGDKAAAAYAIVAQKELGKITDQDANPQLKTIADQGGSEAAYLYASELMQQKSPSDSDKKTAHQYLLQAEKAWHPEAFYLLAYGYEVGWFDSKGQDSNSLAWSYYLKSAERFYGRAMLRVGNAYREGELTSKDSELAQQWFLLCSRQGNTGCAYNAAVMLDDGEGVSKDFDTAYRLFAFAAEQGYAPAMNRLALMHLFGQGTQSNVELGVQWLKRAADKGSVSAYYYLGVLYFEGKLIPKDIAKAKAYLEQAKAHPKASQMLQNWAELTKSASK